MLAVLVRRLLQAIPALLGVTLVSFLLLNLSGDPTQLLLPAEADAQTREAFRAAYGLDRPLPVQYFSFLTHAVTGDFGQSFAFGRPALSVVFARFPATLELAVSAMILAICIAIPAGIISALTRGSFLDRVVTVIVLLGQSVPTFWMGIILILVVAVGLNLLPVSGRGTWQQMILPSLTLAIWLVASLTRLTRSEMLETLSQDYVRTARAKGLSERVVVMRHALRNGLIPIVTVLGLQFGGLLGGALLTETVFAWPGVGKLMLDSILKRDYPVVLAAVTMIATVFILMNLIVDVLYTYLDPRVRSS